MVFGSVCQSRTLRFGTGFYRPLCRLITLKFGHAGRLRTMHAIVLPADRSLQVTEEAILRLAEDRLYGFGKQVSINGGLMGGPRKSIRVYVMDSATRHSYGFTRSI